MAGAKATVSISKDLCKGCRLCVEVCPPKVLKMSEEFNAIGYQYPLLSPGCTGCEMCAVICPELVFEVYRERKAKSGAAV